MSDSTYIYQETEGYSGGWIILSLILTILLIIFIILWVVARNNQQNQGNVCFGPFGVETGVDANAINRCGTNQSSPCVFGKNSIADCENQCNTLSSICQAFTFNDSTLTMKIVIPSGTFVSSSANLFVRQSGMIST